MAVKVDDLSIIDSSKEAWNIVVKVIRLWVSPNFGGGKLPFSMELVLMDAKVLFFWVICFRFPIFSPFFLLISCQCVGYKDSCFCEKDSGVCVPASFN